MTQPTEQPTSQSIHQLLDTIDLDPQTIEQIRRYIESLEERITQLEDILADVNPELDLSYPSKTATTPPPAEIQKPLILIVEDDLAINAMIKSIVESEGYAALSAETGQDGLDIASHHTPNLIICDIHLPGMHGLEVVRNFKAIPRLENVPIIMLTADLFKAEASFELGADEYIMKPIRKNQLMSYITKYLATV